MAQTFNKESILIEWVPYSILAFLSLMFFVFTVTAETVFMVVGCAVFTILFAAIPIWTYRYLNSFASVSTNDNTISVAGKNGAVSYTIPEDLRRVRVDADDLRIELENNGNRFLVRTRFLKNNAEFHRQFDRMIQEHPPSTDRVVLTASVLEMMDQLKAKQ